MLLYQLSQWLDERQRLQKELRGDVSEASHAIRSQIQELEERLYGQARQWMASFQTPAATAMTPEAYDPPQLADPHPELL